MKEGHVKTSFISSKAVRINSIKTGPDKKRFPRVPALSVFELLYWQP